MQEPLGAGVRTGAPARFEVSVGGDPQAIVARHLAT